MEKQCTTCGTVLRNDTYGGRCEDCYIDGAPSIPRIKIPSGSTKRRDKEHNIVILHLNRARGASTANYWSGNHYSSGTRVAKLRPHQEEDED